MEESKLVKELKVDFLHVVFYDAAYQMQVRSTLLYQLLLRMVMSIVLSRDRGRSQRVKKSLILLILATTG